MSAFSEVMVCCSSMSDYDIYNIDLLQTAAIYFFKLYPTAIENENVLDNLAPDILRLKERKKKTR